MKLLLKGVQVLVPHLCRTTVPPGASWCFSMPQIDQECPFNLHFHLLREQEAGGSNPLAPTSPSFDDFWA